MAKKKVSTHPAPPPAVIDGFRILYYAHIRPPIVYSGHSSIFVDGREVGCVPRVAVGEGLRGEGIAFLLCDRHWHARAHGGDYKSVSEARRRVERMYPGVDQAWIKLSVSKREARRIEKELWRGEECSFCGRIPPDFQQCLQSGRARICNICVAKMFWDFSVSEQCHSSDTKGNYYPKDGFQHIHSYMERLLSSKRRHAFLMISALDATRGFAFFLNRPVIQACFVSKASQKGSEEKIRDFFTSRGIRPSRDYVAGGGTTRIIDYPVHGSAEELTSLAKSILREVCDISTAEPLSIRYKQR